MSLKLPVPLAVHILLRSRGHLQSLCTKSRTFASLRSQRRQFGSQGNLLSSRRDDVAVTSTKSHLRKKSEIPTSEPFSPGLFNINVSSFEAKLTPDDGQPQPRKHPYLNYGTHLDPTFFRQLSQGQMRTSGQGDAVREVFHPKLTPRVFYNEAKDYKDTAVIYPRKGKTEMAPSSKSSPASIEELLDQHLSKNGIPEQDVDLHHTLDSFLRCSDEELLGKAEDTRFIKLSSFLGESCCRCGTEDFVKVLTLFARVQIRTSNPALRIVEAECERRCHNWKVTASLLVCDSLRLIGLNSKPLNRKIFSNIEQQFDQLTRSQAVQLIYLIGENRHCTIDLLDRLQDLILKHIDTLSVTELGAVCQGFFKSRTTLKPTFINALFKRVQSQSLDRIHSFYIVGILKVFRQAYFGHRDLFNHIGEAVVPRLQNFPISSIMHIILTYATLHIHDKSLLDAGARELVSQTQECRCKDISKFLWSFATLNHYPDDSERFFKMLIARMVQLLEEYEDFPVFLVSGLLSLAYLNIYPAELINIVFSQRFLLKIDEYGQRSNINPQRDLFLLHSSVKIECPEYQGNHLSKDFFLRRPLSQRMLGSLSYELSQRPILRQVADTAAAVLGGKEYVKLGFTLPHMKTADIEIILDAKNCPISFDLVEKNKTPASQFPNKEKLVSLNPSLITNLLGKSSSTPTGMRTAMGTPSGTGSGDDVPKYSHDSGPSSSTESLKITCADGRASFNGDRSVQRDTEHQVSRFDVPEPVSSDRVKGQRLAILVWSRNHFHFNGRKLLGLHSMKRRQLLKLGYKTVEIPFFEWDKLSRHQAQEDYVRQKIKSSYQDNKY